jgi:hypothetical protein
VANEPWEDFSPPGAPAASREPWEDFAPPQQRSLKDEAIRQAGLTARGVLKGTSYLLSAPADLAVAANNAVTHGVNKVAGTDYPVLPYPGDKINSILDANFPAAENGKERFVQKAITALTSAPGVGAAAAGTGARALAPMAETTLGTMTGTVAGVGAGSAVDENYPGHPFLSFLASLAGGTAGAIPVSAVPNAARQLRMQAMEHSGITPSIPDVTQSKPWQLFQHNLESIPFGVGNRVQQTEMDRLRQAQGATDDLAAQYGNPQTVPNAGEALQTGVERYRYGRQPGYVDGRPAGMTNAEVMIQPTRNSSIAAKANVAYDRVPVPAHAQIDATNTHSQLVNILYRAHDPALDINNPTLQRYLDALNNSGRQISWQDLRDMRTTLRQMRNDPELMATIGDRQFGQLNDALTTDMVNGANAIGGPNAGRLVQIADNYYARSMERIRDNLTKIWKAPTPEAAYGQLQTALLDGAKGDINKVAALRRALTDEEWGDVAATMLDRMGRPVASQALEGAPPFSAATFMTNYERMSPAARSMVFNGGGRGDLRDQLDNLVTAVSAMKGTQMQANTSRSGQLGANLGTFAALATSPVKTGLGLLFGRMSANALYNPTYVRLMTRTIQAGNDRSRAAAFASLQNWVRQQPDPDQFNDDLMNVAKAAGVAAYNMAPDAIKGPGKGPHSSNANQ